MPASFLQQGDLSDIARSIAIDLGFPELGASTGQAEQVAVVSMPEATIDKNDGPVLRQNDVRPTRKAGTPQPVAEALRMQGFPHQQLDLRVLAPDPRHLRRALLRGKGVNHDYAAFRSRLPVVASTWRCGFMMRATSAINGTTTELPNCL